MAEMESESSATRYGFLSTNTNFWAEMKFTNFFMGDPTEILIFKGDHCKKKIGWLF